MSTEQKPCHRAHAVTVELGGLPISRLGLADTVDLLVEWAGGDKPRRVATANVDFLRNAESHPGLRTALRSADLVTADGFPLVALSRLAGAPILERVAGADLVPLIAEPLARQGRSIYLLGGKNGVASAAARRLQQIAPSLKIAGLSSPFIDWSNREEAQAVAEEVRRSGADVIMVALGSPKQELFLERWLPATGCSVGMGVGGTFDFLADPRRRAPTWVQHMGFEWAHRLLQEPRRLAGRYLRDAGYLVRLSINEARSALGLGAAGGVA